MGFFFSAFVVITAASAEPLRFLLSVAGAVTLRFSLLSTADDCCEGHTEVKRNLVFARWLNADGQCSDGGKYASKRHQNATIRYETAGTCAELTGEDFQNTETYIVVRSAVFAISSAHKSHLARDAHKRIMGFSMTASRAKVSTWIMVRGGDAWQR